jgi:hypothetical protein
LIVLFADWATTVGAPVVLSGRSPLLVAIVYA